MLTLYYLMKKSKNKTKLRPTEYLKIIDENKNTRLQSSENLSEKCRVCLREGVVPIFGTDDTAFILETLLVVANVEVKENDGTPKLLCDVCHEFITGAALFRKIAKDTEQFLQQPVKQEVVDEQDQFFDQDHDSIQGSVHDSKPAEDWDIEDSSKVKAEKQIKIKYTPKVTCNVCHKVINRSYYKEHMTMHDPDHKKYICDVCGKSFRLRCAYHNHSLRHGKEFPYKCQLCPYQGRYSELLKTHMRTHTGDYRYMCTECPARFLFKSNLNSHALKHKEPQLQCDACKRAFHTKLMLQRHYEADHLGIKNHVCNICGKAFGYRNAMMKHQRHVHKRAKLLFGRMPAYLEAQHGN
ncbi:zinc finger protein 484-like [Spodoptera litura]|uniref:Zinc finger protein 484-like n=1 Tax=Spodoptera litura TaxID=69820 RepID=A0A9J7IVZ1_SPOLT|nr:zinc finger protein 484-like [Spodoptera litura]